MKRILALVLSIVLMLGVAVPAYATGDGNIDGGGGNLGDGSSSNYWNPGMDGVRVSIVDVDSHSVVTTPIDLTNQTPTSGIIHFGKVSKLSYNAGRSLSPVVGGYSYRNPAQSLPRIISSGSYPASIDAIRSYFTDEQVIRSIAGYVGMDFDTLIGGDYKIVIEPIAYLVYEGAYVACCGTSIQPVLKMLERVPQLNTVLLCLDNDEAGHLASQRMRAQLAERYAVERLIPENKDWNDDLTTEEPTYAQVMQ